MRVLAIDVGTRNLGWAFGAPGEDPSNGVYKVPATQRDLGWLLADIRAWLQPALKTAEITHIVYEAPILNPSNNFLTIRKVNAIGALIELVGYDMKLPVEEQLPGKVRKYFLSPHPVPKKSADIKEAVMARCRQLGWSFEMDDDADALALLDYTMTLKNSRLAHIMEIG